MAIAKESHQYQRETELPVINLSALQSQAGDGHAENMSDAKESHRYQAETELPVINISALQSQPGDGQAETESLCSQVREACQKWGCFRVINHGVEDELTRNLDSVSRSFFNLPTELKERATSSRHFDGYFTTTPISSCESISFPQVHTFQSLDQYTQKLWPEGNPQFYDTLRIYSCKLVDLANSILKLIIKALGLESVKVFPSDFEKCEGDLRLNYYSGDGDALRFVAHTDVSILSILYEEVGGLEIRSKDGEWLGAKPLPASFLIITGDSLKIWSNDRCWSAEHRVVYGGDRPRLSAILFWNFPPDKEVRVPEDLIDDEHPQHYKSFVLKDYMKEIAATAASLDMLLNKS